MEGDARLTVRLSSDSVELLTELSRSGKYSSPAEAVRVAVDLLIDANFTVNQKKEVLARAADRDEIDACDLTSDGTDPEKVLSRVLSKGMDPGDGNDRGTLIHRIGVRRVRMQHRQSDS